MITPKLNVHTTHSSLVSVSVRRKPQNETHKHSNLASILLSNYDTITNFESIMMNNLSDGVQIQIANYHIFQDARIRHYHVEHGEYERTPSALPSKGGLEAINVCDNPIALSFKLAISWWNLMLRF